MLCDVSPNSKCWNNECNKCTDDKKLVPSESLTVITSYRQWENTDVPCHSKESEVIAEVYKKIAVVTKDVHVGEIMESFQKKTLLKSKSTRVLKELRPQNSKLMPTTPKNEFLRLTMHRHISVNYKMKL